jgi:hypothetical protein
MNLVRPSQTNAWLRLGPSGRLRCACRAAVKGLWPLMVDARSDNRNPTRALRGLACFIVLVMAYFALDAWYFAGTRTITVKAIGLARIGAADRMDDAVQDISGVQYAVSGARYPIFGGPDAGEIQRRLKVGCRYEISYHHVASFSRAAFPRDALAISDAKLIDCPQPKGR